MLVIVSLILYRALLAISLVRSYIVITKQKFNISNIKKEILLLLFSGALMGIKWILLFEAYKYTTVSIATLSYYFAPVLVTINSPIIFKEILTKKQIISFVFSTIGLVMITGTIQTGNQDFIANFLLKIRYILYLFSFYRGDYSDVKKWSFFICSLYNIIMVK